jgi:uncharacterized membrane protein YkvA (DUF1232 family)
MEVIVTEHEDKYSRSFSEESFWEKVKQVAMKAGCKVIFAALILYYTFVKPETPTWAKASIVGALGYFIFPLDAIPDLTPLLGYGDDLGVLAMAISTVAAHVDQDVIDKAEAKLKEWFAENCSREDLDDVTSRLLK